LLTNCRHCLYRDKIIGQVGTTFKIRYCQDSTQLMDVAALTSMRIHYIKLKKFAD
jgi:hypothetical protein